VVVCGSAARGEEIVAGPGSASDVDVMVVTASGSLLLGRAIQRVLARHAANGLEGSRVPLSTLARHRTVLNYEARQTGVVVAGDATVLELVPVTRPDEIPAWEAVRLLFNRMYEHVKFAAGLTSEAHCVRKSYEALGEAELIVRGRYRPTFAERVEGVRAAGLATPVDDLPAKYLLVHEARFGASTSIGITGREALDDLCRGLRWQLAEFTGAGGDVEGQLAVIAESQRHYSHRLYWLAASTLEGRPLVRGLRWDPVLDIWRRGYLFLSGRDRADPSRLVRDWRRCPQILDGAGG
jgi:hypothetical protein